MEINKAVFRISWVRYGIVVSLIAGLCVVIGYLAFQYNQAKKLQVDVERLMMIHGNSDQIDKCLLMLYMADNDSRLYSLTSDVDYLQQFSRKVQVVDSILANLKCSKIAPISSSSDKISGLMDRKNIETMRYLTLRRTSDSLIADLLGSPQAGIVQLGRAKGTAAQASTDTLAKPRHKKLLGRIAAAVFGKRASKTDVVATPVAAATAATGVTSSQLRADYRQLDAANSGMKRKEKEILLINSRITGELTGILNRFKVQEQQYVLKNKTQLRGTLKSIFVGFSELSVLAGTVIFLLVSALLYNLWKIFRHENRMLAYSIGATRMAEEKSAFLANMSHEIRTPLNSIAGFAEQLEQGDLDGEQSGQIKAVRRSAGMLLNVVNQVLDFSKYENGKMSFEHSSFLLDDVVNDVVVSMGVLAEEKGLLLLDERNYPKDLYLAGDAFRLKQVMINLLGNAIKFTKAGEVSIRICALEKSGTSYELQVFVSDTGVGIAAEDLPFVFKKFAQVGSSQKQSHAGTGLGLAISKSIVELQQGSMAVKSELGQGSEFSFILPFVLGERPSFKPGAAENELGLKALLKDKHVLLAEDNSINVMLARTILTKWGMSCTVAHNGKEALALLNTDTFDIILTDIQMPEMDGEELAVEVRRLSDSSKARLPILALTANVMKEDHQQYLDSGIDAIAMKPFLEKELVGKIGMLLKAKVQTA